MPLSDVAVVSLYPASGTHAGRSGVASYTVNLTDALADAGARVSVVAQVEPGVDRESRNRRVRIVRAFARGPSAIMDAARAAIATAAPVVHIQVETFLYGGPAALPGLVPALSMLHRAGRRVVVTLHQVVDPASVDRHFVRLHRVRAPAAMARAAIGLLQRLVARSADAVVVHEPAFRDVVPDAVVVPHGIESPVVPKLEDARLELGLDGQPVVLCFGFVAPYKGLEAALEAASGSRSFGLVVAGGDHPRLASRDDYASRLRSHWAPSARFTGYVAEDDIARWFAAADVALYPYRSPFSSSGSLALALAYDRPVLLSPALATTVGADDELRVPIDPRSLQRRLEQVVSDRTHLQRVHRATRALAAGRTWPDVARRHLELYEEVFVADGSPRGGVRTR